MSSIVPAPTESVQDLPLEQLEHQITELAAHIYAATCRWLLLVAEFDRREAWRQWGCKSAAHWLSWQCGVELGPAREQVRVARRLTELPLVRDGFERGELSYSKARAISRVATPQTEESLVEMARHSTAAQLEKLVRAYRGVQSAELEAANAAHARRFLSWRWEEDGTLSLKGRLGPEEGAAFIAAIEQEVAEEWAAAAIESGRVSAETPDPALLATVGGPSDEDAAARAEHPVLAGRGARSADAFARLVEAARCARAANRSPAGLAQVVIHADEDSLRADEIHDRCHLEDGPAVPPETARRLTCDGSIVLLRERAGRPLDVGRLTRTIHPALRRALENRDGGCTFPGCHQRRRLHAHHLVHWSRGGRTDRDNLTLVCAFHHRLVHEGGFDVRRVGGETIFIRPDGTPVVAVPPPIEGRATEIPARNAAAGHEIDARTCLPHWHGEQLDVHLAVSGLCEREARGG